MYSYARIQSAGEGVGATGGAKIRAGFKSQDL